MKYINLSLCLFLTSCGIITSNSNRAALSSKADIPDYRNRADIIAKLGYAAEIKMYENDRTASNGPSVDWIYYLEYSENRLVRRIAYTFKDGKCVGAPTLDIPQGGYYRILNTDDEVDFERILKERKKPIWKD